MIIGTEQVRSRRTVLRLELSQYIPPLILAAYGVFILSLYLRGAMTLYINPVYIWPTTTAGIVLLGLGVGGIVRARVGTTKTACGDGEDCGCESSDRKPARLWPYVALCVPLLLAALLQPQGLAAFSALQRGPQVAGLTAIHGLGTVRRVSLSVDTNSFSLQDWAGALSADPNPKDYSGKPVTVSGMVLQAQGIAPPGYFMVMRYQVTCCIADARPIGLVVKDTSHGTVKNNQWVKVTGVMGASSYQGSALAVVEPKSIQTIKPGNPYMY
ncbi:MAG: TIGR03943 family protein [Chloroflexota bacterium]|nr:TIGR03943 family protein [Chloroflexota bacterium]